MGYNLQCKKTFQSGEDSTDRDAKFRNINKTCLLYMEGYQPVVSIECRKRKNAGNSISSDQERQKRKPAGTKEHDLSKNKAASYDFFDSADYDGYVNAGAGADTADFAVSSLREWWYLMGKERYQDAVCLYITCDGRGSKDHQHRLWRLKIQELANELDLMIQVSCFSPGTFIWNRAEHQ